ncbi:hypothetical protein ONO86_03803 [Micromonospora noduli]|nr:hypothetical protein ONO86_03803 [Micromonospora noduli]
MNGRSSPTASAPNQGDWVTYSSGRSATSSAAAASV